MSNRLLFIAALFFGGFVTVSAFAAGDFIKEGGIGGTGAPVMRGGIGGTGSPEGGIGGTGLRPSDESALPALAGRVLYIVGQVEAQNSGEIRQLSKGDAVRVGDTLKSGKGASTQLRMEDGGTIALLPESQLAIESFAYHGVQDGSEHLALALLGGGFRAVTGNIGNLHKENYSIRTPNAKVGILGTDHETIFVPIPPAGQAAVVEPGTYNHVISGATTLQSEQGKLLIKPNQTGFAALNGGSPVILNTPLPIFGDPKASSEEHAEHDGEHNVEHNGGHHGDMNNSDHERNGSSGLSDSLSGNEHDQITQTDRLSNGSVDLNTLERDAEPAVPGSAVVGAHMAGRMLAVGSAVAGNQGETLFSENNMPGSYSNNATGFNFIAKEDVEMLDQGWGQLDGTDVTWGIYADGTSFDVAGNAIKINFHPFAYANGGATPQAAISAIGGTATFSNMLGYTKPVTESGNLGGSVNLNVGVNLGTATITSYNLSVVDVNSRNWTGTLNGTAPLATFAANGIPLAVACGGASCGSGAGSGFAAGMLVGPNAKGLISSYVLSTTTGQAVAGAALVSRP